MLAVLSPLCCYRAAYQRTMHQLVKALQTSIEAEAQGAKEFEVRAPWWPLIAFPGPHVSDSEPGSGRNKAACARNAMAER